MECEELKDASYEIDTNFLFKTLKETKAERVVLQLPDGLKHLSPLLASCIKRALGERTNVYVSGEGVYGACDLDLEVLENTIRPDLIVHIGHTPYPSWLCSNSIRSRVERAKVIYVPAFSKIPIAESLLEEALNIVKSYEAKKIGLVAVLQHINKLRDVEKFFKARGLEPIVPQGVPPYLLDGQIIGCEYGAVSGLEVDVFLYLGGGLFHPIGLYLTVKKPVIKIDPHEAKVVDVTPIGVKYFKIRLFKIQQAMSAKRWAVVIGTKTCQYRDQLVESIRRLLEEKNKEYLLIIAGVLNLERIAAIDNSWIEAFVVTSCPRLPIDDLWEYHKPVLTPGEMRIALTGALESYSII
ncbi:MAG: diphthamide biosynthesis enzyme Dph2 [Acidilobaceae archaeon]